MTVPFVTQLEAIRDNLAAELAGETARRAAIVAAGNPAPATYTVSGKTVQWTEYLTAILDKIAVLNQQVIAAGGDGGIIEEYIRAY